MKIAILSRNAKLYSTRRLREAALERGHKVRVLDTLSFSIMVEEGGPQLYFRDKRLGHYDAVIPRIGASITFYGTAVLRQFEQMGVFTLNSSHAISVSRDKLRSSQILSRHHIGMPPTMFVRDKNRVLEAIEHVGGTPIIIKLLEGTQGVGVIMVESAKTAKAIIETLQLAKQNVIIQKFVEESRGRDIRAFVVGSQVVAAMRRVAQGDEFRSNVHQGGRVERIDIDPVYEQTAIRAAQILGLHVAGVDMLEGEDGPKVMEVNSSPGLEGIERATGIDVAGRIIRHLEDRVLFPELDLRQRLTLKAGYGIVEIPVGERSELAGRKLRDAGLRKQEILVLNIQRQGLTIPSPSGDDEIRQGDVLLCFGKMITLKALIPSKRTRRRKRTPGKRVPAVGAATEGAAAEGAATEGAAAESAGAESAASEPAPTNPSEPAAESGGESESGEAR